MLGIFKVEHDGITRQIAIILYLLNAARPSSAWVGPLTFSSHQTVMAIIDNYPDRRDDIP